MWASIRRNIGVAIIVAVMLGGSLPSAFVHAAPATWTAHPASDDTLAWRGVVWSPELKIFVGVGAGANGAMTSPDGSTWTPHATPDAIHTWRGVAWSPQLGLFAAVGNVNSGTTIVMTSPDGANWTLRDPGVTGTYMGITWSPEQSKFVATAAPAAGALTSLDGITWTPVPSGAQPTGSRSVIWVAEDNQYVTVRSPTATAYTSPDGSTWTPHVAPKAGLDLAYSETNDIYVSVGNAGVMTSPDGITWTSQTSPITNLRAIVWSPENNEFAAVGLGGIMTSPDGINWTTATDPASNSWDAITWSPELSRYVATSVDGTNRTMVGIVPTVPTAPLNLSATLDALKATLTWTAPVFDGNATIAGYRIERSVDGGPFEELVVDTGSPATNYNDTTVQAGMTYSYRVYALNSQGQSLSSNEASVQADAVSVDETGVLADTGIDQTSWLIAALAVVTLGICFRLVDTRKRS